MISSSPSGGLVSVRVGALFPLEKPAEAQRTFATGSIAGKVILEIGRATGATELPT
jgi:hypothetical protein